MLKEVGCGTPPAADVNRGIEAVNSVTHHQDNPNNNLALACGGCGHEIAERWYLRAADRAWHCDCLRCCHCRVPLAAELTCFARDGNIYCKEDYYRCEFFCGNVVRRREIICCGLKIVTRCVYFFFLYGISSKSQDWSDMRECVKRLLWDGDVNINWLFFLILLSSVGFRWNPRQCFFFIVLKRLKWVCTPNPNLICVSSKFSSPVSVSPI